MDNIFDNSIHPLNCSAPNPNPKNIYKIMDMSNSLIKMRNSACQFSANSILEELNRDTPTSLSSNLNFNLNDENAINIEDQNSQNIIIEGVPDKPINKNQNNNNLPSMKEKDEEKSNAIKNEEKEKKNKKGKDEDEKEQKINKRKKTEKEKYAIIPEKKEEMQSTQTTQTKNKHEKAEYLFEIDEEVSVKPKVENQIKSKEISKSNIMKGREEMLNFRLNLVKKQEEKKAIAHVNQQISKLRGENSNLKGENSMLKEEISMLKKEISMLKGQNSMLRGEISNLKEEKKISAKIYGKGEDKDQEKEKDIRKDEKDYVNEPEKLDKENTSRKINL